MNIITNQFKKFIDLDNDPNDFRESIQSLVYSEEPLSEQKLEAIADLSFDDDKIVNIFDVKKEISEIKSLESANIFVKSITEDLMEKGGLFSVEMFLDNCPVELRIALEDQSYNSDSHLIWTNHVFIYEWYKDKYRHCSTYFFKDKED